MSGYEAGDYVSVPVKCGHVHRNVEIALRRLWPKRPAAIVQSLWIDGMGRPGRRFSLTVWRGRLKPRHG